MRPTRACASLAVGCLLIGADGAWVQKRGDTVSVLYAGSLGAVMDKGLAPAAERATGYGVQGEGDGSARLHGGKIWVKSQVGGGSTFTLPVRRGA